MSERGAKSESKVTNTIRAELRSPILDTPTSGVVIRGSALLEMLVTFVFEARVLQGAVSCIIHGRSSGTDATPAKGVNDEVGM
jgi:hypothetical protein